MGRDHAAPYKLMWRCWNPHAEAQLVSAENLWRSPLCDWNETDEGQCVPPCWSSFVTDEQLQLARSCATCCNSLRNTVSVHALRRVPLVNDAELTDAVVSSADNCTYLVGHREVLSQHHTGSWTEREAVIMYLNSFKCWECIMCFKWLRCSKVSSVFSNITRVMCNIYLYCWYKLIGLAAYSDLRSHVSHETIRYNLIVVRARLHVLMCMYICMYVCMHVWMCVCVCACVCACLRACVHACVRACVRTSVCVCVCACGCACACACVCVRVTVTVRLNLSSGSVLTSPGSQENHCGAAVEIRYFNL